MLGSQAVLDHSAVHRFQNSLLTSPQEIDEEQQVLEEKGVALETQLRSEVEDEDETAMERAWAEWFQLVNRKNELFRREMELYHTRRMQVNREEEPKRLRSNEG